MEKELCNKRLVVKIGAVRGADWSIDNNVCDGSNYRRESIISKICRAVV